MLTPSIGKGVDMNKVLTANTAAMTDNLILRGVLLTPEQRAAGIGWYRMARREARSLAKVHRTTIHRAAGIIAALSPRCRWEENVARASKALVTGHATGLWAERANAIMAGAHPLKVLSGPKTRSFYRNIMGNTDAITVDVWAYRAALDNFTMDAHTANRRLGRANRYEHTAQAYRDASEKFRLLPSEFQAAIWVSVRGH